jgi:lipooligosaccharide transport system ATP-binding protein
MIGVVPQEENLDRDLKVLENLLVYARYYDIPTSEARERAMQALTLFQLQGWLNGNIEELSGGMKRRLIIARALINQPKILILDEPTTGLDPQARHVVWQTLRLLREQGTTLVLTTQFMDEAEHLCDRLVIMDHGKILTTGRPRELVEKYVGSEVLELTLEPSARERALQEITNAGFRAEITGDELTVFGGEGMNLRDLAERYHLPVTSVIYRPAQLEDVFLKLTGRALREI